MHPLSTIRRASQRDCWTDASLVTASHVELLIHTLMRWVCGGELCSGTIMNNNGNDIAMTLEAVETLEERIHAEAKSYDPL